MGDRLSFLRGAGLGLDLLKVGFAVLLSAQNPEQAAG